MDDFEFGAILEHFNLSWQGYRKVRNGVKKRLSKHMDKLECRSVSDYILLIEKSKIIRKEFQRFSSVSISRFFRDKNLWYCLLEDLLPRMAKNVTENFRVWSAGCASGEEAYSFSIIWWLLAKKGAPLPGLEIIATDINPDCLKRAKKGDYTISSIKEIPYDIRELFFDTPKRNHYVVKSFLKKDITWKKHSMFNNPPGNKFNIIFLRNNLLTYYNNPQKIEAFNKIVSSLSQDGILVIGSHEKIPDTGMDMTRLQAHPNIYCTVLH